MSDLLVSQQGYFGIITLNRPKALNALTLEMVRALHAQLLAWEQDSSIQAVLIESSSDKAFCAGGDVRWLYERGLAKDALQMQFFADEYRLNYYIHRYPKPYLALMDGLTMGGGVGISLHGSHPITSERFSFAMPETSIGFFPDIGAGFLLSRCPKASGTYLGLTGNRINAREAKALGLVKEVVAGSALISLKKALLALDLSCEATARIEACLGSYALPGSQELVEQESIHRCFSKSTVEQILQALLQEKSPWGDEMAQLLQLKSPLSLKITLAQLQKVKENSLADCLKLDFCLASRFMQDKDFYEGVRALLIEKDNQPHWQPSHLISVTQAKVADYFECGHDAFEL